MIINYDTTIAIVPLSAGGKKGAKSQADRNRERASRKLDWRRTLDLYEDNAKGGNADKNDPLRAGESTGTVKSP